VVLAVALVSGPCFAKVIGYASALKSGVVGDGPSVYPDICFDARFIVFQSQAANLVPGGGRSVPEIHLLSCLSRTLGLMATEARVREEAPGRRVLHIASHALIDPERPLGSALVLTSPANRPQATVGSCRPGRSWGSI